MNIERQLKLLLKQGEGETYYSFANADGKRWWVPVRHMTTSMNLYQPSGTKGRLLKRGLPWLHWNPLVRKVLHAERIQLALGDELRELLERIFGQQDLEFAIFGGTPCIHQKITMQISWDTRILGYVKVTESKEIYGIFEHEKKILDTLYSQGMKHVPECLYCGSLKNGLYLFVQSTVKTLQSEVVHAWGERHERFLKNLMAHTRQIVRFEDSDFYRDLNILEERLSVLGNPKVLYKAIQEIKERYTGQEVEFSAFQADFTPWNMFVEKGQLFVFDWEYARLTYPAYLDYFHFWIQTEIFEAHLTAEQIVRHYTANRGKLQAMFKNPDWALQCYLLAIISIYLQREQGILEQATIKRIDLWMTLLEHLKQENE